MTKAKNTHIQKWHCNKSLVYTGADVTISPTSWHPDCPFQWVNIHLLEI